MRPSNRFVMALYVALIVAAPLCEGAVTCGSVLSSIRPCISYLQGSGAASPPPGPCCGGVKTLAAAASSTPDKQTACGCLKNAAQKLNINSNRAQTLPNDCGISLSIPISTSVDCTKIS